MTDISIIVPAYNAEKYIKKCIESLINQTKKEIEIIIVNDGSTDNTEKIVKSFKDQRIKYYKNSNHGIGYTRNFGIDKAVSDYIMFVDSDDYLREDACQLLYDKICNEFLDLVICDYYRVIDNNIVEDKLISFKNTNLKDAPNLLSDINLSPWNKIYKTSLIKDNNIKFNEELKYEDTPFVAMALDKAKIIGKIDECLNYYVIHEVSETTVRDRRCFDIIQIMDLVRDYFKDKEYASEALDKLTVRTLTNYTIQQRVQIDKKIGMKFIDEAFSYLKREVPDYKNNKYYENRGILRRAIEKSKLLSKLYCGIYHFKNMKKLK